MSKKINIKAVDVNKLFAILSRIEKENVKLRALLGKQIDLAYKMKDLAQDAEQFSSNIDDEIEYEIRDSICAES
jgi:hypothetical protein